MDMAQAKVAAGPFTDTLQPHVKGVRKYTCRFLIGIENDGKDKAFSVVRRIIGSKGANMKRIFKSTDAKLRLRGRGSGYFEGASQKESNEPLQLCVSCTSVERYKIAVGLAEELLESIYREYRVFCREQGRPEVDLKATPQVVSGRWDILNGGGSPAKSAGGLDTSGSGSLSQDEDEDEGLDDDGLDGGDDSGAKKEKSSRRGRRSRGGKNRTGGSTAVSKEQAPSVEDIEIAIDQRNEARRQCNFT